VKDTARLVDIFEFIRNGKSVKQSGSAGGLPITRIETIASGTIDSNRVGYAGLQEAGNEKWLLQGGDILFSHINSVDHIGKCALFEGLPEKLVHGMNLLALRPNKQVLDARYAYRAISSPGFRASLQPFVNKAVNQASISTTNLKSLEIPLPALDEQRRIAAMLDKADALRRKRRRALQLLDGLTQSTFLEMFGDPFALDSRAQPLSELAEIYMGQSPAGSSYNSAGLGVPLLNGPTEFGANSPLEVQWTTQPTRLCESGDILLCVRGATAGRLNTADKQYCIGRGLAAIRPFSDQARDYLLIVLNYLYPHFQSRGVGSTFINISRSELEAVPIPIATQTDILRFSGIYQHMQLSRAQNTRQLASMENLFSSLQSRAFTGQL
jgi:type I restriction enzyme S subunit